MCDTCGCGPSGAFIFKPTHHDHQLPHTHEHKHEYVHLHDNYQEHPHHYHHSHEHLSHDHAHEHGEEHKHHNHEHIHTHAHSTNPEPREIILEQNILQKNDLLAKRNRISFNDKNIFAINLVSSPGSGKTTLLERTLNDLNNELDFFVIEGDQQTFNDADRIAATGTPVIQINTGNGCHLDADMINEAVLALEIKNKATLIIENVGNLVCPALFDLGEHKRIVVISTTEGEDKPIKYPTMFATSQLCIINKIDLLPHLDFDMNQCKQYALHVNPNITIIAVSAKTGEGMLQFYQWLNENKNAS